MSSQLKLFENKSLFTRKEDIKNYKSYSRIKKGYHKPLEIIDESIDIEFLKERLETY